MKKVNVILGSGGPLIKGGGSETLGPLYERKETKRGEGLQGWERAEPLSLGGKKIEKEAARAIGSETKI